MRQKKPCRENWKGSADSNQKKQRKRRSRGEETASFIQPTGAGKPKRGGRRIMARETTSIDQWERKATDPLVKQGKESGTQRCKKGGRTQTSRSQGKKEIKKQGAILSTPHTAQGKNTR